MHCNCHYAAIDLTNMFCVNNVRYNITYQEDLINTQHILINLVRQGLLLQRAEQEAQRLLDQVKFVCLQQLCRIHQI